MTDTTTTSGPSATTTNAGVLQPIGDIGRDALRALGDAASAAGLDLAPPEPAVGLAAHLASSCRTRALVVDLDAPGAASALRAVRSAPEHAGLPVLAIAAPVTDLTFAELFESGGDDVVARGDEADLVPRLRALSSSHGATTSTLTRGLALVAAGDAAARTTIARGLRSVGYDIHFAADGDELHVAWAMRAPALVVIDASLPPSGGARELRIAREDGRTAPCVVTAAPRFAAETRATLAGCPRTIVHDAFSTPDGVVFLANEVCAGDFADHRAAPRLLYGTRVWVRRAGAERDVVGYTYTVSEGGVFVRTLAALSRDEEVWLELFPPRTSRRVRLAATVRWTRRFGRVGEATSPAGMGLRIDGGLPGDLERHANGCRALAGELGYGARR